MVLTAAGYSIYYPDMHNYCPAAYLLSDTVYSQLSQLQCLDPFQRGLKQWLTTNGDKFTYKISVPISSLSAFCNLNANDLLSHVIVCPDSVLLPELCPSLSGSC